MLAKVRYVALLTKLAILNNANVTLVDAVIDALTITLIKNNDNLLGTVNSYIKPPLKRRKTKAADSRHAKVSKRRTKKDKDLEDSNTSSNLDSLLDSNDYYSDSSLDINSKDNLEDEEATTAKDLAREQKKRLKALLNAKTRDSFSARVGTAIKHCTLEE
ncbi:hypothetical protein HBI20_248740 [Parastagonospora nodorum]|nr:hypothetical protein HBI20_248740 [Parastagonospora nodorum]